LKRWWWNQNTSTTPMVDAASSRRAVSATAMVIISASAAPDGSGPTLEQTIGAAIGRRLRPSRPGMPAGVDSREGEPHGRQPPRSMIGSKESRQAVGRLLRTAKGDRRAT
jgi:hypothetical protein